MGPTFNFNKKKEQKLLKSVNGHKGSNEGERFFNFFSFKSSLFDSRSSDRRILSGQTRKVLYETRATRGNKKHRISPRIQVKIRKNPSFLFFSDLRRSTSLVISDL